MNSSKEILLEKVENGWIIYVTYFEKLSCLDSLIRVEKKFVAMTEKEKEQILQEL
jgi:hypothetical protein